MATAQKLTLEDRLKKLLRGGKGTIVVVDDGLSLKDCRMRSTCGEPEAIEAFDTFAPMLQNLREYLENCGVHVEICGTGFGDIADFTDYLKNRDCEDMLIMASGVRRSGLDVNLSRITKDLTELKRLNPDADLHYLVPLRCERSVSRAIRTTLGVIMPDAVEDIRGFDNFGIPTVMHYLVKVLMGGAPISGRAEQHNFKNNMWKDNYLKYIDQSLRAGNGQTAMDFHFLVLSDKAKMKLGKETAYAKEKVKIMGNRYDLVPEDLGKCAAIFVDNLWNEMFHDTALGGGINTLRSIRQQLDEKGVNIPIIYQSGHNLEAFTEAERREIEDLGAVLAAKDIFPKVCLSEEISDKEIEATRIAKRNPQLAKYIVQTKDFGRKHALGRGNLYVVCSRIVEDSSTLPEVKDTAKEALFEKLGIEDNMYNHRMYVLAMMHTDFKAEAANPDTVFTPNVENFKDFEVYSAKLGERVEKYRETYNKVASDAAHNEKRTLSHNDAKGDNWFDETVLGDFSNAAIGVEYKDVARAVLDQKDGLETAMDSEKVAAYVDNHIALRQELDPDFKEDADVFKRRVFEAVFTEALRLAYFKKVRNEGEELVDKYIAVAEKYFNLIQ